MLEQFRQRAVAEGHDPVDVDDFLAAHSYLEGLESVDAVLDEFVMFMEMAAENATDDEDGTGMVER